MPVTVGTFLCSIKRPSSLLFETHRHALFCTVDLNKQTARRVRIITAYGYRHMHSCFATTWKTEIKEQSSFARLSNSCHSSPRDTARPYRMQPEQQKKTAKIPTQRQQQPQPTATRPTEENIEAQSWPRIVDRTGQGIAGHWSIAVSSGLPPCRSRCRFAWR